MHCMTSEHLADAPHSTEDASWEVCPQHMSTMIIIDHQRASVQTAWGHWCSETWEAWWTLKAAFKDVLGHSHATSGPIHGARFGAAEEWRQRLGARLGSRQHAWRVEAPCGLVWSWPPVHGVLPIISPCWGSWAAGLLGPCILIASSLSLLWPRHKSQTMDILSLRISNKIILMDECHNLTRRSRD